MQHEQIDELLAIDPIAKAEKIIGRGLSNEIAALGLLFQMDKSERVAKALSEMGDVDGFHQDVETYINILKSAGFQQILVEDIPQTNDKFYVFWLDGVLVSFDTYWGHKSINGGNVYLNYEFEDTRNNWFILSGCSHGPIHSESGKGTTVTRTVSIDCRQALLHKLNQMRINGTILKKWKQRPFLWLLHYMDTKVDGYDYDAINEQRISQFPIEVREAISPTT